jgi:hypothetical protein
MKTREEIIKSMCYTYRHDYGLLKQSSESVLDAGMSYAERNALWNQMAQIFDNDIWPFMNFREYDDWK